MNFEGQNISLSDALFVDNITGDLENWRIKSEVISRVLVFPPVNNYHRFLIHKVRVCNSSLSSIVLVVLDAIAFLEVD